MDDLTKFFKMQHAFDVLHKRIDYHPGVVWSIFHENKTLDYFHNYILDFLEKKYRIILHYFDQSYVFHSTLFLDPLANNHYYKNIQMS